MFPLHFPPNAASLDNNPPLVKNNQLVDDPTFYIDYNTIDLQPYHDNVKAFFNALQADSNAGHDCCANAAACITEVGKQDDFMKSAFPCNPNPSHVKIRIDSYLPYVGLCSLGIYDITTGAARQRWYGLIFFQMLPSRRRWQKWCLPPPPERRWWHRRLCCWYDPTNVVDAEVIEVAAVAAGDSPERPNRRESEVNTVAISAPVPAGAASAVVMDVQS